MDILVSPTVGFFVIFLGSLFLFGELLVKAKGIFALLGISIMTLYFTYHVDGMGFWVILLYLVGLTFIILDGKFIGDGTLAFIGLLLMILGLALPAPGFLYGALAGMGLVVGAASSFLFLKVFPRRNLWSKMTLKYQLSGEKGYNSLNESYKQLVGKQGKTVTPFRPTGTIEIEGKQYSATTENLWLESGQNVVVVDVDGTRILIKPVNPS